MNGINRRRFFQISGAAAAGALLNGSGGAQGAGQSITVNVAVLSDVTVPMTAAVVNRLKQTGRFQAEARALGKEITVNWKQFPYAPPLLADASGGGVQLGSMATFPIMNALSKGMQIAPLHVSLGIFEFMIVVRNDHSIRDFSDLRGKTVGLALGTALQQFFETFTQLELRATPKQLGIKLINMPIPTATLPPGVDALVTYIPAWLPIQETSALQVLVNSFGETGPAYDGPLGKGAGHLLASVKDSPFSPEGYIALRNYFCTFDGFSEKQPEVTRAWISAYQETLQELTDMSPMELSSIFPESLWATMPRQKFAELALGRDLLYKHRGWIWPTAGDIEIMAEESEIMFEMGVISKALTEPQLRTAFRQNLPLLKSMHQKVQYPSEDVFTAKSFDRRGPPLWNVAD